MGDDQTEPAIARRKASHLEVAASGRADFAATTLFEHVHLVHEALSELALEEIDLSTELVGKRLAAPLVISGMTGGTEDAAAVNRDLARAAEAAGIALGVGSQRAMAEHPDLAATYQVRAVAPDVVLIGNLGAVQLLALGIPAAIELAKRIGADALAIHLNPGQELIQPGGDRDFRGLIDAIRRLVEAAALPILVKETGCGLSLDAARKLAAAGVTTVDTAGAGGTSWVAVEALRAEADAARAPAGATTDASADGALGGRLDRLVARVGAMADSIDLKLRDAGAPVVAAKAVALDGARAQAADAAALGRELWDWGVPTAVSVAACVKAGHVTIASGGMRSGLDVARALALGARAGGMAAPMLRAQRAGGADGVSAEIARVVSSIRSVCLLAGCRTPAALAKAPRHLATPLRAYLEDLGLL